LPVPISLKVLCAQTFVIITPCRSVLHTSADVVPYPPPVLLVGFRGWIACPLTFHLHPQSGVIAASGGGLGSHAECAATCLVHGHLSGVIFVPAEQAVDSLPVSAFSRKPAVPLDW